MKTLGDRLRAARGRKSREEAAQKLEVHPHTLGRYENDERDPPADFLRRAATFYDVEYSWLIDGDGAPAAGGVIREEGREPRQDDGEDDDAVSIPLFDIQASAGSGQIVWDEQPTTRLVFPRAMLQRMGVNPRGAKLLLARGDSMEPTIGDGNLMLVDTSDLDLRDDVFVLRREDSILVKRLQRMMDGSLALRSDNAAYGEERLPRDEAEDIQVIARVRMTFKAV